MIGKTLKGRYQITGKLGEGAMGEVYLAQDNATKQDVAIKILPPRFVNNEQYLRRFEREVAALRDLNHPNIVTFIDNFMEDEVRYLVMAYMPGGSLYDRLKKEGALPVEEVKRISLSLIDALTRVHRLGMVHRDIKPENILFDAQGMPYLTDFGVTSTEESAQEHLTGTGVQIGTPYYMSPEAWSGEEQDAQSDIWSLGVVMYELLAGTPPFEGGTAIVVMQQVLQTPTPDLLKIRDDCPPGLYDIIRKALAKERSQRYQNIREMGADIERGKPARRLRGEGLLQESTVRQRSWLPLVVGLVLILIVVIGGLVFFGGGLEDEQLSSAQMTNTAFANLPTATDTVTPRPSLTPSDTPIPASPTPRIASGRVLADDVTVYADPGENFDAIASLMADQEVQVLSVSEDDAWYQVLDGNLLGWVGAENLEVFGNLSVIEVVALPTATYTPTPTDTATPTDTPTLTPTPTSTATFTPTDTPTATFTPTDTPTATFTPSPTPLLGLSGNPVRSNAEWEPQVAEFDGIPMVLVPSGCFSMGSDVFEDTQPIHLQCFEEPFWIDQTELTLDTYQACVDAEACDPDPIDDNANRYTFDGSPIHTLNLDQAHQVCEWRGGRLPTEPEWEYAARGPDSLVYPWGNDENNQLAINVVNRYSNQPNPIGSVPEGHSWVGALDMVGNASEWVSSAYWPYPYIREHESAERPLSLGALPIYYPPQILDITIVTTIYSESTRSSDEVGQYFEGELWVYGLRESRGWFLVYRPDEAAWGWLVYSARRESLVDMDALPYVAPDLDVTTLDVDDSPPRVTVDVLRIGEAGVYYQPSVDADRLGLLRNAQVDVVGVSEDGAWYQIQYGIQFGWVRSEVLASVETDDLAVGGLPTWESVEETYDVIRGGDFRASNLADLQTYDREVSVSVIRAGVRCVREDASVDEITQAQTFRVPDPMPLTIVQIAAVEPTSGLEVYPLPDRTSPRLLAVSEELAFVSYVIGKNADVDWLFACYQQEEDAAFDCNWIPTSQLDVADRDLEFLREIDPQNPPPVSEFGFAAAEDVAEAVLMDAEELDLSEGVQTSVGAGGLEIFEAPDRSSRRITATLGTGFTPLVAGKNVEGNWLFIVYGEAFETQPSPYVEVTYIRRDASGWVPRNQLGITDAEIATLRPLNPDDMPVIPQAPLTSVLLVDPIGLTVEVVGSSSCNTIYDSSNESTNNSIGVAAQGEQGRLLDFGSTRWQVRFDSGINGWIMGRCLRFVTEED